MELAFTINTKKCEGFSPRKAAISLYVFTWLDAHPNYSMAWTASPVLRRMRITSVFSMTQDSRATVFVGIIAGSIFRSSHTCVV